MKKIKMSILIGFALVMTLIYCPVYSLSAGSTRIVNYNLSIPVDGKQTYYVNNLGGSNNVSSLSVKTSKKSCATVQKSGNKSFTVKGKSAGSAKVTVTVRLKKEYNLKKIYKYIIKVKVYQQIVSPTPVPTTVPIPTAEPTVTPTPTAGATLTPISSVEPIVSPSPSAVVGYTFRYPDRLTEHFKKHGIEMGFATEEEYLAAANAVIVNPEALHKLEAEDNDHVYFVEATGEIVFLSQDGYIRTYFITNKAYFERT